MLEAGRVAVSCDWGKGATVVTSRDPDREEDEGYLAAEAGRAVDQNPYPPGTLRFDHWRRGWRLFQVEMRVERTRAHLPDDAGQTLADNPHPPGTIRFEEWRDALLVRQARARRARRLGRAPE
jgi:ribosome modulation factor